MASRNVSHFLRVQLLLMLFSETKIFLHRSIYHTEFGETATPQKNAHSRKCESLKLQILILRNHGMREARLLTHASLTPQIWDLMFLRV